jgi:tetratricopeptide (TPR) repeat protein
MRPHYDEDELAQYALLPERFPGRTLLETHLTDCPDCLDLLRRVRELDDALAQAEPWTMADAILTPSASRDSLEAMAAQTERIGREAVAAEADLQPLLYAGSRAVHDGLEHDARFHTAGAVRILCRAANGLCEREPADALRIADAAIIISEQLDSADYGRPFVFSLIGTAWKERANALRYLGSYPTALEALDRAARAYRHLPLPDFELAIVSFVRATIFQKSEQLDRAIALAEESARVFASFGDRQRYVFARMVTASAFFHQQRYAQALEVFTDLIARTDPADSILAARLALNAGMCELRVGRLLAAGEHFTFALAVFEHAGVTTEAIRARWSLAELALVGGRFEDGVVALRGVLAECERAGMMIDAALVLLDLADTLLGTGRAAEVAPACTQLVQRFQDAGMVNSALLALSFVREAAQHGRISHEIVEHVRTFFRRYQQNQLVLFAPPAP